MRGVSQGWTMLLWAYGRLMLTVCGSINSSAWSVKPGHVMDFILAHYEMRGFTTKICN